MEPALMAALDCPPAVIQEEALAEVIWRTSISRQLGWRGDADTLAKAIIGAIERARTLPQHHAVDSVIAPAATGRPEDNAGPPE